MVTPATRPTAYTGISAAQPRETYVKRRSPLPSDFQNYQVGDRWVDIVGFGAYTLVGKAAGVATWQAAGGSGGGGISQFTTNNAAVITPVAGNVNLFGNSPAYGIQTKNGGPPGQIDILNVREMGRYVVGPGKEFTSIQAAINQAVLDGVSQVNPNAIWVLPGIYNESIVLSSGISVIGFQADGRNQGILVNGFCSQIDGVNSLENIAFVNNAAAVINCASTAGAFLFISRVSISNPGAGTGIFIGGPANTTVFLTDSVITAGNFGVNVVVGTLIESQSQINATTAIQLAGNSGAIIDGGNLAVSSISGDIALSGTCNLSAENVPIDGAISLTGTSTATVARCSLRSNVVSAINIAAGCVATAMSNTISSNSGSTFWAAGAGAIKTDSQNSLLGGDTAIAGTLITSIIPLG